MFNVIQVKFFNATFTNVSCLRLSILYNIRLKRRPGKLHSEPSRIYYACLDHPRRSFGGLYRCQNLVGIDAVVLIICMFFDFSSLAWKRLFTPPKLFFLGIWPLNGEAYQRNPQKHILGQKDVIWRIDRQNRSTGVTCARDEETKKRKRQKPNSGKLGICRDHPRRRIDMKFWMVGGLQVVVLRFEFHQNRLSGFRAVGGRNSPIPIDLAIGLYNSLYYRTRRDVPRVVGPYMIRLSVPLFCGFCINRTQCYFSFCGYMLLFVCLFVLEFLYW